MSGLAGLNARDRRVLQFLRLIADAVPTRVAAEQVGLSHRQLYRLREKDEQFAALWRAAYERGTKALRWQQ